MSLFIAYIGVVIVALFLVTFAIYDKIKKIKNNKKIDLWDKK